MAVGVRSKWGAGVWKITDKPAFSAGTKVPWRNGGQEGQVVAAGLGFDILHSIR